MALVLRDLVGNECYVFIGDVIVYRNTIEEHASRLSHVLERFDRANLQLQPGKCVFAQPQVEYLGYIVSRDGIRASPDKTKAAKNYPIPKNVKEVRSFLGLASFYRWLVPKIRPDSEAYVGAVAQTHRLCGLSDINPHSRP